MDRVEKAVELFKSGYNCSQAVVGAYADAFGVDAGLALKMSEGFGGGIGRMRLTCGAVSGMAFICGLKYSNAKAGDTDTRTKIYETVRKMAKEFEDKNGSIECAALLGLDTTRDSGARPENRTKEYYQKRPCVDCVRDCAQIIEKYLME